jgi:hypothetical protein
MAHIAKLPAVKYLRACVSYCPKTGVLRWRTRLREHFPSEREWKRWNSRYAGTVAGMISTRGYRRLRIDRHRYKAHRLIWKLMTGKEPPDTIDHIDGNTENNIWHNLRAATQRQQTHNARLRKDNLSGYRGVRRRGKGWLAFIKIDGATHDLGCFPSMEQAVAVRQAAARRLYGEFYRSPS